MNKKNNPLILMMLVASLAFISWRSADKRDKLIGKQLAVFYPSD